MYYIGYADDPALAIAHFGRSARDGAPGRGSGRYPLGSGEHPRSENNGLGIRQRLAGTGRMYKYLAKSQMRSIKAIPKTLKRAQTDPKTRAALKRSAISGATFALGTAAVGGVLGYGVSKGYERARLNRKITNRLMNNTTFRR